MTTAAPPPVLVQEYRSARDYQRDATRRAAEGYHVQDTMNVPQRPGIVRIVCTGGLGLILLRPKPRIVVTYRRAPLAD